MGNIPAARAAPKAAAAKRAVSSNKFSNGANQNWQRHYWSPLDACARTSRRPIANLVLSFLFFVAHKTYLSSAIFYFNNAHTHNASNTRNTYIHTPHTRERQLCYWCNTTNTALYIKGSEQLNLFYHHHITSPPSTKHMHEIELDTRFNAVRNIN